MDDYKNDIEKYLKGELTPAQMNALEKRALSDPFLADALEGLQQLTPDDFESDLNYLNLELKRRTAKQKSSVWLWPMRIAAGLVVMAISTYLIVLSTNKESKNESGNLALSKQKEVSPAPDQSRQRAPAADSIFANKDTKSLGDSGKDELKKETTTPNASERAARSQSKQPVAAAEDSKTGAKPETRDETLLESEDVTNEVTTEEKIAPAEQGDVQPPSRIKMDAVEKKKDSDEVETESARRRDLALPAPAESKSLSGNTNRKIIRGKVTFSDDGTGLPGVNVIVKGTNEGTVTDAQGNYQIPVEAEASSLIFSFIGFTSKEVDAKSNELNVQLDADVSELSEVVVVGYGSSELGNLPSTPPVMELAAPAGGRKLFKEYLEENLRYPEQALKNQVEGKVTIQFTIGTSGQLSDFRILRGIGHGCDEEVIRLIKEGPKWSPTKKNEEPIRDRVKVRLRFALPKK